MASDEDQSQAPGDDLSRLDARALFQAALEEPVYTGKVYHLVGRGGIGKSYELRLIDGRAKMLCDTPGSDLLESGIIDLAHTRYNQPLLLLGTLARRIIRSLGGSAEAAGHFDAFFREADRYLNVGGEVDAEATSQQRVRERFLEGYRAATVGRRVVFTFDTFERLDPRIPEVERYNFRNLPSLEAWLVDLIAELPNSLVFIAGRVRPRQAGALRLRLGGRLARCVVLPPLTAQEVRDFLQREEDLDPGRDLEWYERMYEVSGGLPVRLIVAVEIARASGFDPDHLPPSLRGEGPVDLQQLGHDFAEAFVGSLYATNPQLAQLIELACYLRKGLHADLIQELLGSDPVEVRALLGQLGSFGFVKVSGDGILTLHDDVYDLLENRLGVSSADGWRARAIAFLERARARLIAEIERLGMSIERLGRLRMVQVDRLYYQLAREPTLQGYQNYCELAYSTIFARDAEFDTQLQDELARFYDPVSQSSLAYRSKLERDDVPWERICYDEAVRWAFRRIHAPDAPLGGYGATLELANRIEQDYRELIDGDALARSALEIVRLEALGFLAVTDEERQEVMARYAELTQALEAIEAAATAAATADERPIHHYRRQQSRFLRAYALNNWGYLARREYRLHTAIECYRAAIEIYKTLGDETTVLRATSLNNIGFALRLQGRLELGLVCIEESITLQRQAGARYREAAGHNTRARLQLAMDNVLGAQQSIAHARALLCDFPDTRNVALLAEHEGMMARRLAVKAQDDQAQSEALYGEAIEHYERFKRFFDESGSDKVRWIDARQGLGTTYRSRGAARRQWGEDGSADMETARLLFREARELLGARDRQSYVDLCEDIAFTFVLQGRYAEALEELKLVDYVMPRAFDVRPGAGAVEDIVTREQRGFWLQLSKVEFLRGLCHFALGDAEAACQGLLRSFAFVMHYAPESVHLRTYREVAVRHLLERYRASSEGARELAALRHRTYLIAQRLGTREAFFKLEHVFEDVDTMLKLL